MPSAAGDWKRMNRSDAGEETRSNGETRSFVTEGPGA
jgi:hypothetical protein